MNYNGTPITDRTSAPGIVDPVVHWTPSLAVCGLDFYHADAFPRWKGSLLSGALAGQELRLLRLEGESVVGQEVLVKNRGRVRDVVAGPEGPHLCRFQRAGAPSHGAYRLTDAGGGRHPEVKSVITTAGIWRGFMPMPA